MIAFLTSSPTGNYLERQEGPPCLDHRNGLTGRLKKCWRPGIKGLLVSADPAAYQANDEMRVFFSKAFANSGLPVKNFEIWDNRNWQEIPGGRLNDKEDIRTLQDGRKSYAGLNAYGLIILAGGHVPTQNAFLMKIGLRERLKGYQGIVMGISAGTMNSADLVYAQPELEGESFVPSCKRFLRGLNITKLMVLPHFQVVRNWMLDGRRLVEDITFEDSVGREFYALVDGSYLYIEGGRTLLCGEGYRIADRAIEKICGKDEILPA